MLNRFDREQKLLFILLGLAVVCLFVMVYSRIPFVLTSRSGVPQAIPHAWIFSLAFLGLVVPLLLRNLGGLLAILSAGLICGGTLLSCFHANEYGSGMVVSWVQWLMCIVVVVAAVVGVSRMNVDFTNVGIDDLLN